MTQRRMLLVRAPGERIAKRLEMKDPPQVTRRCQIKFRTNLFRILKSLKISHKIISSFFDWSFEKFNFKKYNLPVQKSFLRYFPFFRFQNSNFSFYCAKLIFRVSTKTGFFALIKRSSVLGSAIFQVFFADSWKCAKMNPLGPPVQSSAPQIWN